ncbi:RNA-binding protein involved in heterochromatin assembly dri1-like isoform X1 [Lycium ferocissimum]|uniref:RNA-binding protein involved in heterochromatin assembly dri1-like isoform X1 n=2 Tax=Lycium ferocissimum TaxID=112874 RepID=UPI002815FBE8|nr:RNA-binding protein involved in heterochromatin assembly dri1-like isoform X1 [Lycium ferocissimum]
MPLTMAYYMPFTIMAHFASHIKICSHNISVFIFRFPRQKMSREGDWMCAACHHQNFKKRDACQRCSCPKYATMADVSMYGLNTTEVLAGDWYCSAMNCGSHNYASRTSCYRCGALKSGNYMALTGYGYDASARPGWKSGDWICSRLGCGMHNYASRAECYKCKTTRDFGGDLRESEFY